MPTRAETLRWIAGHELSALLRARMVTAFAALFALLAIGIAMAGLGASGQVVVQGYTRTAVSLMSLGLYLLPLLGLIMGAAAFGGEDGGTELLLAQPVGRGEVLFGRTLGLLAGLALVSLAGFGGAGLVVGVSAGTAGLGGYLLVAAGTTAVGMVGVGAGVMLGVLSRRRAAAVGWALAAWFGAAVLYDLIAIGLLQVVGGGGVTPGLVALLGLNPIDGVRVMSLVTLGADVLLGPTGAALQRTLGTVYGTGWILGSLGLWLALPLLTAARIYGRRDF